MLKESKRGKLKRSNYQEGEKTMKKMILLFISITVICSSSAMAKKVTVSALSFRPSMGSEGLSLPQGIPNFLYSADTDPEGFVISIADLDLKQGDVIKKLNIYIKTNNAQGAIYPILFYTPIKTGATVSIVGTEAGIMPDPVDSYHIGNNPGSEITKISVPFKVTGHVVNNKKYTYFILVAMSGGGGTDVGFYGATVVTK